MVVFSDELVKCLIAQFGFDFLNFFSRIAATVAIESNDLARLAVEHAAKVYSAANWPIHGIGANAKDRFNFFHELERIPRFAVKLVYERENRDMAERANLEKFFGLGFDAFCSIDDHNGSVGGH